MLIIPTLGLLAILLFFVNHQAGQDSVDRWLEMEGLDRLGDFDDDSYYKAYVQKYSELGFDKPDFYFSVAPSNYPKTLNEIANPEERKELKESLCLGYTTEEFEKQRHLEVFERHPPHNSWHAPSFRWHGVDNQFHQWIMTVVRFDFGDSVLDGRSSVKKLWEALPWTLSLVIFSIILTTLIAVPFGIWLSGIKSAQKRNLIKLCSFLVYSIPVFWLATLAVMFMTNSTYGEFLHIFPSVGVRFRESEMSTWAYVFSNIDRLLLPVICMAIHYMAFAVVQVESTINRQLSEHYIQTLRMKGINERSIRWKYAFRNGLIPILTMIISGIPSALGGSVIIEVIFNLPGIGRLLFSSINAADWNVISLVVFMIALISIIVYFVGDLIYTWINPKVRFSKTEI